MAVRVRVAGSGTLVAWKVPWSDVSLTEERLLSAVSLLGDMVRHAELSHAPIEPWWETKELFQNKFSILV